MNEMLYCPGIFTMAGFCPEVEEADDDGTPVVVLYRDRKVAEVSVAMDAREWARQVIEGERSWADAKAMIDSLAVVDVEIDDSGAAIALDSREGMEGCYEEVDYGYLPEMPEPDSIMEGWLADKGGYIIEGEEP